MVFGNVKIICLLSIDYDILIIEKFSKMENFVEKHSSFI